MTNSDPDPRPTSTPYADRVDPLLPPAAGHATRHLGDAPGERVQSAPLSAGEAMTRLKECSGAPGLLVV